MTEEPAGSVASDTAVLFRGDYLRYLLSKVGKVVVYLASLRSSTREVGRARELQVRAEFDDRANLLFDARGPQSEGPCSPSGKRATSNAGRLPPSRPFPLIFIR